MQIKKNHFTVDLGQRVSPNRELGQVNFISQPGILLNDVNKSYCYF